jgi:A/G-specific adenine glycosylase
MLKKKQRNIVRTILRWYTRQGRNLPWRNITNSYRILISEIMLQQTHVSRVLVKYPEFLKSFPTLRSLAKVEQSLRRLSSRNIADESPRPSMS